MSVKNQSFASLMLDEYAEAGDLQGLARVYARICEERIEGPNGNTVLMHLASSSPDVLQHLIDLGEDPLAVNENKQNVFHICAIYGYADSMKFFVGKGYSVDARSKLKVTALEYACDSDSPVDKTDCIRILLEAGSEPNPTVLGSPGILHILCKGRAWETKAIQLLVASGARVDQRHIDGSNALTRSLSFDRSLVTPNSQLVGALLDAGATFDPYSGQFERAVRLALTQDDSKLLTLLHKEHGNVIDVRFTDGDSALHEAFIHDAASSCLALLELGVNPELQNDEGKTIATRAAIAPKCALIVASFLARKEALSAVDEIEAQRPRKGM